MASSYLEPIPPLVLDLLALLEERLPSLQFPEADGCSVFDVAAEVKAAAALARRLDEAAEQAYRDLATRQRQLLQKAARAQRYARIYVDAGTGGEPGLARALDAIALPVDDDARGSLPPLPARTPAQKQPRKRQAPPSR